ncbi:hypothetical protein EYC84_002583 [Monilinia fructicola]|uniref:Uncharacterized protein n=1 Tax=Monilinia fructicola TaxID=38448 RepID=A0A5M9JLC0_MONFR|nr:hypothetical protein EYC84_002583 [Monilinia fructicola]
MAPAQDFVSGDEPGRSQNTYTRNWMVYIPSRAESRNRKNSIESKKISTIKRYLLISGSQHPLKSNPSPERYIIQHIHSSHHTMANLNNTPTSSGTAENPTVLHPGFVPLTISFSIPGLAYKEGFKKPIGPFPTLILSSLIRLMTAEKIGALADVPPLRPKSLPFNIVANGSYIRNASSNPVINPTGTPCQRPNVRQCLDIICIITQRAVIGIRRIMLVEKLRNEFSLVVRYGINVAESATRRKVHGIWMSGRVVHSRLGVIDCVARIDFCGANRGYVWASTGPCRVKNVEIWAETTGWAINIAGIV